MSKNLVVYALMKNYDNGVDMWYDALALYLNEDDAILEQIKLE